MKPFKCNTCPRFKSPLVTPVGTTPAEVVFLLDEPPFWGGTALSGRGGDVLKALLKRSVKLDTDNKVAPMLARSYFMHSISCGSKDKGSVKLVQQCKDSVGAQALLNSGASVVIAMGPKALNFLGIKGILKNSRGTVKTVQFLGKTLQVVTTFSLANLLAKPGLAEVAIKDFTKASSLVAGKALDTIKVPKLLAGYQIPTDLDSAIAIAEEYCAYAQKGKSIEQSLMSLDFETTTLFPWNREGRAVALSGAVAPGKAFAVYIDHRDSPYSIEEFIPWVWKILQSPHPKTWWNYKFDYGVAKYLLVRQTRELLAKCSNGTIAAKIENVVGKKLEDIFANPINNTRWDGMLAEHMLDEDKKGHYSLKEVLSNDYPSLAGYEESLQEEITKLKEASSLDKHSTCVTYRPLLLNSSPIGCKKGVLGELESLNVYIKNLKKTAKRAPLEHSNLIHGTIDMLANRATYLKEVKRHAKNIMNSEIRHSSSRTSSSPNREEITYEMVPVEVMMPYAAIDADLTYRISTSQRIAAWKEDPRSVAQAEGRDYMMSLMEKHYLPLTECLSDMQVGGVRIDVSFLEKNSNLLHTREKALETSLIRRISSDLGREETSISLHNPSSLADLMIAGYGLPKLKLTESGEASSSNEVMAEWAKINPIAQDILDYRAAAKARSTYLSNLLDLSSYDSRVHGNIKANGTATGRLASSSPNLQNQPPVLAGVYVKKAFVTTDTTEEGKYLDKLLCTTYNWEVGEELCVVDIDFAGAEVRGLTVYARDPGLLKALNAGMDMHSWVASIVFNEEYSSINLARKKEKADRDSEDTRLTTLRQQAKAIVFGLLFCIGPAKLSEQLGISPEEAVGLMRLFYKRFPLIESYINNTKRTVSQKGILRTPTGRARRFPLASMGGSIGAACQRQGVNYLVQGFTSEIVVRTLINLHKHLPKIKGRLMLTVHDSMVFEMPKRLLPSLEDFLSIHIGEFISKEFPIVPVKLPYDIEVGSTYGDAKYSIESYLEASATQKKE